MTVEKLLDYVAKNPDYKEVSTKLFEIGGKLARNKNTPLESQDITGAITNIFTKTDLNINPDTEFSLASKTFEQATTVTRKQLLDQPSLYTIFVAAQADDAYITKWNADNNYYEGKASYGRKVREERRSVVN